MRPLAEASSASSSPSPPPPHAARGHLAEHKYPRRVEFVDELPLGPSRKVLERELRRQFS